MRSARCTVFSRSERRRHYKPHRATLILVLGIVSFPLMSTFGIGFATGIAACIMGRNDLKLMREGDHWQVWIPSRLGYGSRGRGTIPPNQTLVFDLRLLTTSPPPKKGEPGYVPEPGEKDR